MPQLIQHIDAIARQKQHDVLFVIFHRDIRDEVDYQNLSCRQALIDWLDTNGIKWQKCGHFANTRMMCSYRGQMYLDVPFEETNPQYQMLYNHLENTDGSMRIEGVGFCYLRLSEAMENAHHDVPGFWEEWAENF